MSLTRIKRAVNSYLWMPAIPVFLVSLLIYLFHLGSPAALIFDETYHIPAAQKYLNGIFFEENHPPLGKLFIALGEKIIHPNNSSDQLIGVDKVEGDPPVMNYWGYRFFPALFGALCFPVLYFIIYRLTKSKLTAYLVALIGSLDTASAVQARAAMLDSLLVLTILISVWIVLKIWKEVEKQENTDRWILILGAANAASVLTKHTGLVVIALTFLGLIKALKLKGWKVWSRWVFIWAMSFMAVYIGVWKLHYSIATRIQNDNYYEVSENYRQVLRGEKKANIIEKTAWEIRESWEYSARYNKGVPNLDICKSDEIGSPWYLWPLGGRAIDYRWDTPDGKEFRYIYLQSNPVVWAISLIGVIIGSGWCISSVFRQTRTFRIKPEIYLLTIFYWSYMIGVMSIKRVMYLYHYLPGLFIGLILFALVLSQINYIGGFKFSNKTKSIFLSVLLVVAAAGFWFFSPFVYHLPLTHAQFEQREIFGIWGLNHP